MYVFHLVFLVFYLFGLLLQSLLYFDVRNIWTYIDIELDSWSFGTWLEMQGSKVQFMVHLLSS